MLKNFAQAKNYKAINPPDEPLDFDTQIRVLAKTIKAVTKNEAD